MLAQFRRVSQHGLKGEIGKDNGGEHGERRYAAEHRTPNIEHPTSNKPRGRPGRASDVGCSVLDVRCFIFSSCLSKNFGAVRCVLPSEFELQRAYDGILLAFKGVEAKAAGEEQPRLRAWNHGSWRKYESGRGRGFEGALQAIPLRIRNPAEFGVGIVAQIKDDERQVAVAQKQIRAAHRLGGGAAANPEQTCEHSFARGSWIESIASINQHRPAALRRRLAQE